MQGDVFSYGLLAVLAIALLVAAFTDMRRRQIDNTLNAGIALAAPLFWWASHMSLAAVGWQIALALGAFAVFAAMFALRWMGGGDVKLLSALALWIKPAAFVKLLMVMALAGGVLTVAFAFWFIARRQRERIAIPYGVAIAFGGLWVLLADYLPALQAAGHVG